MSFSERPHGDKVLISNLPHIPGRECNECLCTAGSCHELKFHRVRRIHLHNCPKVAASQTSSRYVVRKCI